MIVVFPNYLPLKIGCLVIAVATLTGMFTVLGWIDAPFGPADIIQSDRPLGVQEAIRVSRLPYPQTAKNVRYAQFSQWIAFESFARFEADNSVCHIPPNEMPDALPGPKNDCSRTRRDVEAVGIAIARHLGLEPEFRGRRPK